jgi:hypothetical protein
MTEIVALFLCLIGYRAVCQAMHWQPWPVVQVVINNNQVAPNA